MRIIILVIDIELKKFDEAEISLKKAIELKPDYAEHTTT